MQAKYGQGIPAQTNFVWSAAGTAFKAGRGYRVRGAPQVDDIGLRDEIWAERDVIDNTDDTRTGSYARI